MIFSGSYLDILDNSGAIKGLCLRVYRKKVAKIGDVVLVVLKSVQELRKVKKSQMIAAAVIQTKKGVRRKFGMYLRFPINAVVLLKSRVSKLPFASRIRGFVPVELKQAGFLRFLIISWGTV